METLLNPERLAKQTIAFGVVARLLQLKHARPLLHNRQHVLGLAVVKLAAGPIPRSPLVLSQLFQKLGNALAELRDRLHERLVFADEPVDAAALVVAARVALRILHVPDERVGPVAEPQRTIRPDLRIGRAEVLIRGTNQIRRDAVALESGPVVLQREARHPVHGDDRGVDELPLHVVGQVPRDEPFAAEVGAFAAVEEEVQALAAGVLLAGKRHVPGLVGGGAVADEALAPFVEVVAPHVVHAGQRELLYLHRARVDDIRSAVARAAVRTPRRLQRRARRDAFE